MDKKIEEIVAQYFWDMGSQGDIQVTLTLNKQPTWMITPAKPFKKIIPTHFGNLVIEGKYE